MKTVFVKREVIDDQILVALDDKGKVAIISSEEDLNILIASLQHATMLGEKADGLRRGLTQLRDSAFGEKKHPYVTKSSVGRHPRSKDWERKK